MNILFIDNFDSFSYNLVDEFRKLGCTLKVLRNDSPIEQLDALLKTHNTKLIVISPGPSHPQDAGICIPLIQKYHGKIPLMGICLGHQAMIEALGGKVTLAPIPIHGKKSVIAHTGTPLFHGVPNPFFAGRYHSLYGSTIPPHFVVTATADGLPMAIEHMQEKMFGVQFHPESILTPYGTQILQNVVELIR
ncbi:aminodeoxychorismate/anthranilate synthase component II [Candidatus Woesearchaeota archaeon]|nr:aminodeoxychorismate/anthranilate synthase component II [Candidatus Woesearchaeota archaeon]